VQGLLESDMTEASSHMFWLVVMAEIFQLLLKSWLNNKAPWNIELILGPPLNLFPQLRGELNAFALRNMPNMLVTAETSQRDKVWLNARALENM
jgi:hypothetical protein